MPDLSENEVAELACTYAALILHDSNVPITVSLSDTATQLKPSMNHLFNDHHSAPFFKLSILIRSNVLQTTNIIGR